LTSGFSRNKIDQIWGAKPYTKEHVGESPCCLAHNSLPSHLSDPLPPDAGLAKGRGWFW
jgi:hypothetical protein